MTIADYVISRLSKVCSHAFTVAGGGAMYLIDSLGRNKEIATTHMVHEQGVALAAESYARLSNSVGLGIVTSGPGGINALNGVANAWYDSIPLIMVSGQVKRADLSTGTGCRQVGLQETDIISMVKSITKYATTITDPNTISDEITKAIHYAKTGRRGPVWIDIPVDIQGLTYRPELQIINANETLSEEVYDTVRCQEVANLFYHDLLPRSKRPLILVGNGARLAKSIVRDVAKLYSIPIVTTRQATDLFTHEDPYLGNIRDFAHQHILDAVDQCDLLLILGARLTPRLTSNNPVGFAPYAKKVMIDIDRHEIAKISDMLTVSACADVSEFMDNLYSYRSIENTVKNPAHINWFTKCLTNRDTKIEYEPAPDNAISMYDFSTKLSKVIPNDAIVLPGSSGIACDIFWTMLETKSGQRVIYDKGTASMGLEIPQAIGASLAHPNRRIISVSGDGGFQLNIHDLEVVRRLSLPITFFVINNSGYDMIRQSHNANFKQVTGADKSSGFTVPDTNKIATAYGINNFAIETADQIVEALGLAMLATGPLVVTVTSIPNEVRAPMKKTPLYTHKPVDPINDDSILP